LNLSYVQSSQGGGSIYIKKSNLSYHIYMCIQFTVLLQSLKRWGDYVQCKWGSGPAVTVLITCYLCTFYCNLVSHFIDTILCYPVVMFLVIASIM